MSADLLADLDSFYRAPQAQGAQAKSQPTQVNQASKPSDPFGFGGPSSTSSFQQTNPASGFNDPFGFGASGIANGSPATHSQQPSWPTYQPPPSNGGDIWGDLSSLSGTVAPKTAAPDDDDGWGDFEVAEPVSKPSPPSNSRAPVPKAAPPPLTSQAPQRTRILRASTIDLMTNNLVDVGISSNSPPKTSSMTNPVLVASPTYPLDPRPSNPNVLFDADDFELDRGEEDDEFGDFGDFEAVAPPPKSSTTPSSLDLSIFQDIAPPQPSKKPPNNLTPLSFGAVTSIYPQPPKSPSFQERNPFPGLAITPKTAEFKEDEKQQSPSPVTAWPAPGQGLRNGGQEVDDGWAKFDDFPADKAAVAVPERRSSWDWDAADSKETASVESKVEKPPPTNVPPPSILLSIFPQLLDLANSSLYKPLAGKPTTVRQRVMSNPGTIEFIRGYLLLSTVAARILAGRKLRWNRDKFLSQSMAISAAGSKGMKLTGVDKTQTTREEREAADVVAVWKEHAGRLRSAVAAANAAAAPGGGPRAVLRIPEIGENMQVQTAKLVPTAPRPCVICGLKRDERVPKVDFEVEDSFGEWWVEHWGHRACRNFWLQHEEQLRQR